ncbi:K02A2.6-like [Cordylochernes scorpioides]|uniref:RNA-directed DNA polymerase n=1 Tax=Cordylochernes scorpioides TaxID=51811 RepID=A0ABY6K9J7_9ARAC|nr:K02A2.6-like [Cordylochernes scorpioides]
MPRKRSAIGVRTPAARRMVARAARGQSSRTLENPQQSQAQLKLRIYKLVQVQRDSNEYSQNLSRVKFGVIRQDYRVCHRLLSKKLGVRGDGWSRWAGSRGSICFLTHYGRLVAFSLHGSRWALLEQERGQEASLEKFKMAMDKRTSSNIQEVQILANNSLSWPIVTKDLAYETRRDRILAVVLRNIREKPRMFKEDPFSPYFKIPDELGAEFGCIQWRERIIIPQKLKNLILKDLHEMHLGIVKMKMIARRYFWWPGLDKNIEDLAHECQVCQESASMPPSTISEWTWPEKPWHRLHVNLAGSFIGKMFIVLVDAYTKWFGLPEFIVTDNGRQFISKEFDDLTKINGIRHTKTSPYNPSSNGLAERYLREFKNSLRKDTGKDELEANLHRFLFAHRAFTQTVVFYRNYAEGPKWKRGTILKLLSCRHYRIGCEGLAFKRYINQLRPAREKQKVEEVSDVDGECQGEDSSNRETTPDLEVGPAAVPMPAHSSGPQRVRRPPDFEPRPAVAVQKPARSHRPQRVRRPPDRLEYY